jgi:hypothetical protein
VKHGGPSCGISLRRERRRKVAATAESVHPVPAGGH